MKRRLHLSTACAAFLPLAAPAGQAETASCDVPSAFELIVAGGEIACGVDPTVYPAADCLLNMGAAEILFKAGAGRESPLLSGTGGHRSAGAGTARAPTQHRPVSARRVDAGAGRRAGYPFMRRSGFRAGRDPAEADTRPALRAAAGVRFRGRHDLS